MAEGLFSCDIRFKNRKFVLFQFVFLARKMLSITDKIKFLNCRHTLITIATWMSCEMEHNLATKTPL